MAWLYKLLKARVRLTLICVISLLLEKNWKMLYDLYSSEIIMLYFSFVFQTLNCPAILDALKLSVV